MHSFTFTRESVVVGTPAVLYVSVNHNGDWSGDVKLRVLAIDREIAATLGMYDQPRGEIDRADAEVNGPRLLNGDVDPTMLPPLIAIVIGPIIAQAVARYFLNRATAAVEAACWLPQVT